MDNYRQRDTHTKTHNTNPTNKTYINTRHGIPQREGLRRYRVTEVTEVTRVRWRR